MEMERMRVGEDDGLGWLVELGAGGVATTGATERKNKVEVKDRIEVSIGSSQLDMW